MARYLIWRVTSTLITLILVSFIIFFMMHAIPGGPFGNSKGGLSPQTVANMKKLYGLDLPLYQQYLHYMSGVIHLNFGVAWESPGQSMLSLIGTTMLVSTSVAAFGLGYGVIGGVLLGVLAVKHQFKWLDQLVNVMSTLFITTPSYVLAIFLVTMFAVELKWLPSGGWGGLKYMVLPAVCYGIGPLGTVARYTRNAMMEEVNKQYVNVVASKGITQNIILLRHVLSNSMGPILTIVLPMIPGLLTGSIFIEQMFNVPGLGSYFVSSILNRDYPLEMTLTLMVAFMIAMAYLVADLLTIAIDPRIRLGKSSHAK